MRRIHVQHGGQPGILTAMPRSPESPASPASPASIVRAWSARATPAGADAYVTHFRTAVLPALRSTAGHRGAMLLRRTHGDLIRITVLTLWESMAAVEGFAGPDQDAAVVEPAARAALADFDTRVEHFELAVFTEP
jgi:heme-degrading monooxygenase HmoA